MDILLGVILSFCNLIAQEQHKACSNNEEKNRNCKDQAIFQLCLT